jgi:hypothetical protein
MASESGRPERQAWLTMIHADTPAVDLGRLGLDRGAQLLIRRVLQSVPVGGRVAVRGSSPELHIHLRSFCRREGHQIEFPGAELLKLQETPVATIIRGSASTSRWLEAERSGDPDPKAPGGVVEKPSPRWGLAARGAEVERGSPEFHFELAEKEVVWADEAPAMYAQAAAAQWDPATAVDWNAPFDIPEEIEDAVVQVMTYLIENETAALIIPASFVSRIHPHFREVLQVLAVQAADEARHIEVFTRRARLRRASLGLSTAGGQASLKTLLDEPDFALASFLLSVLGEGSFLSLLWFLHKHAPDPVTRQIARLTAQDEARHVAFGLAHLKRHTVFDPGLLPRLQAAVERRHETLLQTSGLNEEVFDSLVLLAAGSWEAAAIEAGYDRVLELKKDMDDGRRTRMIKTGFSEEEASRLSGLHTRNFM